MIWNLVDQHFLPLGLLQLMLGVMTSKTAPVEDLGISKMAERMRGRSKLVLERMRKEKIKINVHIFFQMMYFDERDLMLYLESTTELM